MSHEEPTITWTVYSNHICAGTFEMERNTFYLNGLNKALAWWHQHWKMRMKTASCSGAAWSTWSVRCLLVKTSRKSTPR
jgi:hypothetical protein